MKQLYGVFAGADKDKNLARGRVAAHLESHQAAQTVETFAHIGAMAVEKIFVGGGKRKHWSTVGKYYREPQTLVLQERERYKTAFR